MDFSARLKQHEFGYFDDYTLSCKLSVKELYSLNIFGTFITLIPLLVRGDGHT